MAVSNRHAHLTKEAAGALGINPKPERWLGIGENYASDTYIEAGGLRFRVLLPFRRYSQIEILASDCRGLGIKPCYRNSGNLAGAPTLRAGELDIPAIVAIPHVHVPLAWLQRETAVELRGVKMVTLHRVMMWPTQDCDRPVLHIDRDEALALAVGEGTTASMELRLAFQPWPGIAALAFWEETAKAFA